MNAIVDVIQPKPGETINDPAWHRPLPAFRALLHHVIAAEIVDDLQAALDEFSLIAADLKK